MGISHQIDPTPKGKEGATDSLIVLGSLVPEGSKTQGRGGRTGGPKEREGSPKGRERGPENSGERREVSRGRVSREGFLRKGSPGE